VSEAAVGPIKPFIHISDYTYCSKLGSLKGANS
jgi:hypothetical protein